MKGVCKSGQIGFIHVWFSLIKCFRNFMKLMFTTRYCLAHFSVYCLQPVYSNDLLNNYTSLTWFCAVAIHSLQKEICCYRWKQKWKCWKLPLKKIGGIFIGYAFYTIEFWSTFWQLVIFKLNHMVVTSCDYIRSGCNSTGL